MKRYYPIYCAAVMEESADGPWVRYKDAQAEIERNRERIAELEAIVVQQRDGFFEQDKRIAELESRKSELLIDIGAYSAREFKLQAQIAEAQKKVDRYRDALSDIQEHTAGEGGDGYAMQEIADAAMESEK